MGGCQGAGGLGLQRRAECLDVAHAAPHVVHRPAFLQDADARRLPRCEDDFAQGHDDVAPLRGGGAGVVHLVREPQPASARELRREHDRKADLTRGELGRGHVDPLGGAHEEPLRGEDEGVHDGLRQVLGVEVHVGVGRDHAVVEAHLEAQARVLGGRLRVPGLPEAVAAHHHHEGRGGRRRRWRGGRGGPGVQQLLAAVVAADALDLVGRDHEDPVGGLQPDPPRDLADHAAGDPVAVHENDHVGAQQGRAEQQCEDGESRAHHPFRKSRPRSPPPPSPPPSSSGGSGGGAFSARYWAASSWSGFSSSTLRYIAVARVRRRFSA